MIADHTEEPSGEPADLGACLVALRQRFVAGAGGTASTDEDVVIAGLRYLAVLALWPAHEDPWHVALRGAERLRASVLKVLPALREATRYRRFLGELVRGEIGLAPPSLPQENPAQSMGVIHADAVLPDSPTWWDRVRQVLGLRPRRTYRGGFSGTIGVTSFSSKDESPE